MKRKLLSITLYGAINEGKTTTLMKLAINLAGGSQVVCDSVNDTFYKNDKCFDGRMIIEYKGHYIYLATAGDYWAICRGNTDFFEGNFQNQIIYVVEATGVRRLSDPEKKDYAENKKPTVVVTACRPDGDSYGAIKALNAYNEKAIYKYAEQIWLRKTKEDNNDAVAKDIQNRIDNFVEQS